MYCTRVYLLSVLYCTCVCELLYCVSFCVLWFVIMFFCFALSSYLCNQHASIGTFISDQSVSEFSQCVCASLTIIVVVT